MNDFFCHQCTCEFCGNGAHVGYNCPEQVPSIQTLPSFPQQNPCCEDCGGLPKADHCQPPQYTINQPIFNAHNDLLNSQNKLMEQLTSMCDMVGQYIQKKEEEKQIEEEQAVKAQNWKLPVCYDDDDDKDYTVVITPDFLITDSLIVENEHLDTILETESDEFIKSSVENLVPIPSESEDFSDIESECDMSYCDDSQTTKFSTISNPIFNDSTSSDDESSHEEVIHEISFKTYSNSFFDLDEEIISSEFNPIHNEDLDSTPKNDRFGTKSYLLESLLNRDTLMGSSPGICLNTHTFNHKIRIEMTKNIPKIQYNCMFCVYCVQIKDNKEKDKIRTKPDKIKNKREA
nr:hypothetical protein [Tanacetum cinerariifolium]